MDWNNSEKMINSEIEEPVKLELVEAVSSYSGRSKSRASSRSVANTMHSIREEKHELQKKGATLKPKLAFGEENRELKLWRLEP